MGKKLIDIAKMVDSMAGSFHEYLIKILNEDTYSHLLKLSKKTNVYIFSGVIRNYFLGIYEARDFDIVLQKPLNIEALFKGYKIKKNSFGGYKIKVSDQNIDLWFLENTWAIKKEGVKIGIDLEQYIPYTAFFNFSAVTYSFNESKFYYHSAFLSFLRDKKINYVYEPNANTTLCIVNSFYYSDKYSLRIDNKLMKFVIKMHKAGKRDYGSAQIKHFGKVLYSNKDIDDRILNFSMELDRTRKRKEAKLFNDKLIEPWLLLFMQQTK